MCHSRKVYFRSFLTPFSGTKGGGALTVFLFFFGGGGGYLLSSFPRNISRYSIKTPFQGMSFIGKYQLINERSWISAALMAVFISMRVTTVL